MDLKQLRINGDNLLDEYKAHSNDLFENEVVVETRKKLMSDCEDFLANDKIVDFIWKFCFYEAISSFKSHRKRFTPSELTLLQDFIHSGIDYFDGLGSRSPQTKLRCLLYKGDLLRYEHKLIKTDDDVLEAAEECYKQAVHLDPKSASSYSKLACIYETKSPHIALNYLLRAIINNGSSAISSLLKLSSKNGLESVFSLIQNTFGASTNSSFDASLDKFKEFMDKNTSSASILIQNLTTMCLLTIAIEKVPNKDDEMLKTLVLTVCQYLNKFAPILIDQLNKSEILQERRNCPSPFEEDTGDLIESYNHLNIIPEPTLYDNVLFPIIPFILTLNEWIGYLCVCLPSLKLSVGSRMMCQSVIHSLPNILNTSLEIFENRINKDIDDFRRASKWLSTYSLNKSEAFGVLIDNLKQSIHSETHPLYFDGKFKCNQSGKEEKQIESIQNICKQKFYQHDYMIISAESMLNYWPKILFVLDNIKGTKALINSNTIKQLEERAKISGEYNKCLEHIRRLKCLIYEESMGNCVEVSKFIAESDDTKRVVLITEATNEQNSISKNVSCYSAIEYYGLLKSQFTIFYNNYQTK